MSETGTIERLRAYRKTYIAMLVSSVLSLFASLVLSIDAIKIAAQPSGELTCLSQDLYCDVGLFGP